MDRLRNYCNRFKNKKNMPNIIKFYRKNVWGNELKYVADPITAATITSLTGQKTLSEQQIKSLTALGLSFEEVLPPTK